MNRMFVFTSTRSRSQNTNLRLTIMITAKDICDCLYSTIVTPKGLLHWIPLKSSSDVMTPRCQFTTFLCLLLSLSATYLHGFKAHKSSPGPETVMIFSVDSCALRSTTLHPLESCPPLSPSPFSWLGLFLYVDT